MHSVKDITDVMKSPTEKDIKLISHAFDFAQKAHEGQTRYSGDPYFIHVVGTAQNLAELGMDATVIAAGLLHDTLEDAEIDPKVLKKEFGREITSLVEGVTKLEKYRYKGLERHAESLRKLLLAVSKDVRIIIIKLADRLHNMQTLEHVPEHKQHRIALETLEIYAPLANRLGINKLKGELEDLAFPYVYPEKYDEVKSLLNQRSSKMKKYIEKVHRSLQKTLAKEGFDDYTSFYRVKQLYSLYKKLERKDMDIEKVHDIYALRVIVPTVSDCYRVLGIIHSAWTPMPDRIKDYIAVPKPNGYQSLHTSIFTGDGSIVEIQIRTKQMHNHAEFGIAAHLIYKERHGWFKGNDIKKKLSWMNQLIEWQKSISESGEFLESLKMDFFSDRIFIFTPDGDVVDLPVESSPIDFAYAIHSDIGNHIYGVKINEKFSSIDTTLTDGDLVEIITRPSSSPSEKWLNYVKTTLARRHIKGELLKKKEHDE